MAGHPESPSLVEFTTDGVQINIPTFPSDASNDGEGAGAGVGQDAEHLLATSPLGANDGGGAQPPGDLVQLGLPGGPPAVIPVIDPETLTRIEASMRAANSKVKNIREMLLCSIKTLVARVKRTQE